jgi:hypothetical protein
MMHPTETIGRTTWVAAILASCAVNAGSLTGTLSEGRVQLRNVEFDQSGAVTLLWSGQTGKTYVIEETTNPELGWEENLSKVAGSSYGSATTILPLPGNLGARTLLFRVREIAEEDLSRKSEDSKRATDGDALKKDTGTKSATYSATNIDPKHIVGLSTAKGGSNSFAVVPLTGAPSGMF